MKTKTSSMSCGLSILNANNEQNVILLWSPLRWDTWNSDAIEPRTVPYWLWHWCGFFPFCNFIKSILSLIKIGLWTGFSWNVIFCSLLWIFFPLYSFLLLSVTWLVCNGQIYFSSCFFIVNSEQKTKMEENIPNLQFITIKNKLKKKKKRFQTKYLSIPLRQRASTYTIHSLVFS